MKNSVFIRKLFVLVAGLACIAIGVAFAVSAQLGISPIASVPFVYSLRFSPTLGELTMIINLFFFVIQVCIEQRNFNMNQLFQIPTLFIFGYFIDASLFFIHDLPIHNYFLQLLWCLLGCIILAIGIILEVKSNLTTLPSESVINTVARVAKMNFGKLKIMLDTSLVTIAGLSSFLFFNRIEGIREGTLITAVLVGYLIRLFNPYTHIIDEWIKTSNVKLTPKLIIQLPTFDKRTKKP